MADIVERLRALEAWIRKPKGEQFTLNTDLFDDAADEIERLRAALREMAQEDGTNARRMRAAIVAAREKMARTRFTWNGMIIQADGILEKALTVNNARAVLEGK